MKTGDTGFCPVYKKCGGCQLQNLTYPQQLRYKQNRVTELLGRFHAVSPIIGMENPLHYRNKIQAAFGTARNGKIVSGVYPPGSKLPSVRELAADAGVNPNTVQRAFADLERAGLIYTQRTAGKFVTEDAAAVAAARRSLAEAQTRQYLAAMRALGCGKQEIHNLFDQMEEQEHADL